MIDSVFALTDRRNRLIAHCESKYGVRLSSDCKLLLGLINLQSPVEIKPVHQKSRQVIADITPVISAIEDEDEEDDDLYAGMTEDEYFEATKHLVTYTNIV